MYDPADSLKAAVAGIFAHALPEIQPILVIGTITDKAAEMTQFVIFGNNITVGGQYDDRNRRLAGSPANAQRA